MIQLNCKQQTSYCKDQLIGLAAEFARQIGGCFRNYEQNSARNLVADGFAASSSQLLNTDAPQTFFTGVAKRGNQTPTTDFYELYYTVVVIDQLKAIRVNVTSYLMCIDRYS